MIAKIAVSAATYAIDKPYSYKIPEGMTLQPGQRVQLPFGRANKRTEGVVLDMDDPGDRLLLEMYAAHLHERRQQPTLAMPRYLRAKINNRLCEQRMQG